MLVDKLKFFVEKQHWGRILGLVFICGICLPAGTKAELKEVFPDASIPPEQVVRYQLEALRNNNAQDAGIALAFRFASPSNQKTTGPLSRFADMIKSTPYQVMLNYRAIEYGPVLIEGQQASQTVVLLTAGYQTIGFTFVLSRQSMLDCQGCWMTDAVIIKGVTEFPGTDA